MKNATKTVAHVAVLLVLGSLAWTGLASAGETSSNVTTTFEVQGMTCGGCEAGVKAKVKKLAGVESVEASYEQGTARVVYDPAKVTPEKIIAAIEELGYRAKVQETKRMAAAGLPEMP